MLLTIKQMIDLNSKASLVLGGFFNIVLAFLVIDKTPKEMRFFSKIILQTCFYDVTNLIVGDIVQPLLVIKDGIVLVVHFGIAGLFPHPWNNVMFYVWFFCAFAAMTTIVVQFAYRYLILCKNYNLTTWTYFLMSAAIIFLLVILFGANLYITLGPANFNIEDPFLLSLLGHPDFVYHGPGQVVPSELHMVVRSVKGVYWPWIIWHVFFIGFAFIGYLLVFIFGYQMVNFTTKSLKAESGSKKLLEMNKQLTMNLIVQACIPLIPFIGWIMCSYTCILGSIIESNGMNYLSLFAFPVQDWISVFNPLATMIIVKPYRRAIQKWFGCICGRVSPTQTDGTVHSTGAGGKSITAKNNHMIEF